MVELPPMPRPRTLGLFAGHLLGAFLLLALPASALAYTKPVSPTLQSGNALAANLLLVLPVTEGSGQTLHDRSSFGTDCTTRTSGSAANGTFGTDATYGNYVSFDGSVNDAQCSDAHLVTGNGARSFGFLVRTSQGGGKFFAGYGTTGDASLGFGSNWITGGSGNSTFDATTIIHGASEARATEPRLDDGNWHLVLWVYNGTTSSFYMDGASVRGTWTFHAFTTALSGHFYLGQLGASGTSLPIAADLAGVWAWSGALSSSQITAFYNDPWQMVRVASSYTLTGPANVNLSTPATFTVTPNGTFTGTVTLSDGGNGGTLTPSSLTWSGTSDAKMFTYSQASAGAYTISATASPALGTDQTLSVTARNPATYYVSPGGNDANAGTSPGSPWKTVAKVNGWTFIPGDSVLFQGGQTFAGSITFASSGTSSSPIVISSYGTGSAIINAGTSTGSALESGSAGDGWGLRILDAAYVHVSNLKFVGSGVNTTTGDSTSGSTNGGQSPPNNTVGVGIDLVSDTSTGTHYVGDTIADVEVSGFYECMYVRAEPGVAGNDPDGFDSLSITHSKLHDCLNFGIYTYGGNTSHRSSSAFAFYFNWFHRNMYVADNEIYNVPGDPYNSIATGVMMQLNNVAGATVERNVVHDGTSLVGLHAPGILGGGGGIVSLESENVVVQDNEAYNLTTILSFDAVGFDLDGHVVNSVMQRNYSHDNYGPGFQTGVYPNAGGATSGNVFRYNLSVNDARNPNSSSRSQSAFFDFGATGTDVYNNTFYVPGNATNGGVNPPSCIVGVTNNGSPYYFANNLCVTTGNATFIHNSSSMLQYLYNNEWWSTAGTPQWIPGNGTTYTTLSALQALGEGAEKHNGIALGLLADPLLSGIATHGSRLPTNQVGTYTGADLSVGSPAIQAGLDVVALLGVSGNGGFDFHQQTVPSSSVVAIGAVQQASTTTILASGINPTAFGQETVLTASVAAGATGTLTFKDGTATLGTASLSHGSGSLAVSTLSAGSHSLTAVYGGDVNYSGSTSNTVTQMVDAAAQGGGGGAAWLLNLRRQNNLDAQGNPVTPSSSGAAAVTAPETAPQETAIGATLPEVTEQRSPDGSSLGSGGTLPDVSDRLTVTIDGRQVVFQDVPLAAWFAPFVADLVQAGIVSGYRDAQGNSAGLFGPADPVTYAQVVKMALLAAGKPIDPDAVPANPGARGSWAAPFVAAAESLGLSVYRADLPVHAPAPRGAVVATLLETLGIPLRDGIASPFSDLPAGHPYANAILTAWKLGLLTGDTDRTGQPAGTVRPDAPINRAEAAKLVTLARELGGKVGRTGVPASSVHNSDEAAAPADDGLRRVTSTANLRADARTTISPSPACGTGSLHSAGMPRMRLTAPAS